MDPNHAHAFNPSRKGFCKTIVSSWICGKPENTDAHVRWAKKEAEHAKHVSERFTEAQLADILVETSGDYYELHVASLVDEIHRLQTLIMLGTEVDVYSERQNPGGQAARDALEVEARAIREEKA